LVKLPKKAAGVIPGIVDAFSSLPGKIGHFFSKLPGMLADQGRKLVKKAIEIELAVKDAFGHLPEHLYNIGKNLIDGLIHGMGAMLSKLKKKVGDIAGDVIHGFSHGFGILSPSKVMAEMGVNISEGLVVGLDANAKRLADSATRSLQVPILRQVTPALAGATNSTTVNKGTVIEHQDVHLPPAPGHDQMGDARVQAIQFADEMKRRGQR
jgi:hypothetical protein